MAPINTDLHGFQIFYLLLHPKVSNKQTIGHKNSRQTRNVFQTKRTRHFVEVMGYKDTAIFPILQK